MSARPPAAKMTTRSYKLMKYSIFGESHGPAIGVVLEGVPPGLI